MQEIQLKMPKTLGHMELTSKQRRQPANSTHLTTSLPSVIINVMTKCRMRARG